MSYSLLLIDNSYPLTDKAQEDKFVVRLNLMWHQLLDAGKQTFENQIVDSFKEGSCSLNQREPSSMNDVINILKKQSE